MNKNQNGFSVIEGLLIFVIVAILGGTGWYVYNSNKKTNDLLNTTDKTANSTKTPISAKNKSTISVDPYTGWKTYASKVGGFSLRYPSNWIIEGHVGTYGTTTPASQMDGTETSFDIRSTSAKTNAFDMWISIGDGQNSTSSVNTVITQIPYAQGSIIKKLSNGISLWQAGKTLTSNGHTYSDSYPPTETVSNGQFGLKLINGKYLDVTMAFMDGPQASNLHTNYTYDQQINSTELQQGFSILSSLVQN